MKICNAGLTFKYVDEILWCDHETPSAVLSQGVICVFITLQNEIWNFFLEI